MWESFIEISTGNVLVLEVGYVRKLVNNSAGDLEGRRIRWDTFGLRGVRKVKRGDASSGMVWYREEDAGVATSRMEVGLGYVWEKLVMEKDASGMVGRVISVLWRLVDVSVGTSWWEYWEAFARFLEK